MNKKQPSLYTHVLFAALLFASIGLSSSHAQDWYKSKVIIVEGWAELDDPRAMPSIPDIENEALEKAKISQASKHIRTLISEVLAGMIYGYSFSYTPSDKARAVEEQFTLTPVGSVSFKDENLSVVNTDIHNASLFVLSRYNLSTAQVRRAQLWNTSTVYPTMGTGLAMLDNSSADAKIDALYDAIRDAVRRRLRSQLANKPKEVQGTVRIAKNPLFVRKGQSYVSKVKVDMMILDTGRYDTF